MGRVDPFDIKRRIGFSISKPLGIGESFIKSLPLLFHRREDVVTGAVDNAYDLLKLICNQRFLNCLDNRNGTRNCGFVLQRHIVIARHKFITKVGNDGFVRCDNRLPLVQGGFN